MSTPAEYYERYWSEGGYRPVGSLHPVLQHLFDAHVTPSARCLNLGCGDGRTAGLWLSEHAAAYVGVDISQPAVDEARTLGLNARRTDDAGAFPFGDGEFDVVVYIEVLEQQGGFAGVETRGVGGSFLAELPGVRRFVGSEASAPYRALVRAAPTLFGARIHAVARKQGGIA